MFSTSHWVRGMAVAIVAVTLVALQGCDGEEITYPECATFSKNSVAPPTDASSCREACVTAEGLVEVNGNLEDWKGTSGAGECSCMQSNGGHRTICKDASYSAWVASEAQRWRMMTTFSNSRCYKASSWFQQEQMLQYAAVFCGCIKVVKLRRHQFQSVLSLIVRPAVSQKEVTCFISRSECRICFGAIHQMVEFLILSVFLGLDGV